MLMDKETADALVEQQTREINNLKAMRNNERDRAVKLINEFRGKFKNRKVFHTKTHIRERIMKGFDSLIKDINNQRKKKDDEALHVSHPGTQTSKEEDNTMKCKTGDVCMHVDTDALTNPELDSAIRNDGRRINPQDCSGSATGTAKGDTNKSVLPADFLYECGHKTNGVIIMDDNLLSMSAYIQWAEEENNLETKEECFDCYLKKLDGKDSNGDV